jgi:hypothetical protein
MATFTGARGHVIDPHGNIWATTNIAITLPQEDVALVMKYDGTENGGVLLTTADGNKPAGFVFGSEKSDKATTDWEIGDEITMGTIGRFWCQAAAAIAIDANVMAAASGQVKTATAAAAKVGRALTAAAAANDLILIEAQIGTYAPA